MSFSREIIDGLLYKQASTELDILSTLLSAAGTGLGTAGTMMALDNLDKDINRPAYWGTIGAGGILGSSLAKALLNRGKTASYSKKKKKPAGTATKRDPAKWARAKARAKAKMGGKWSARAAQLAVKYYKESGGKYKGKKPTAKNNKLKKWSKQDWQWSGERKKKKKKKSRKKTSSYNPEFLAEVLERTKEAGSKKKKKKGKGVYLPAKAIAALKSSKKGRNKLKAASRKKSKATSEGKQHASHGLHKGKKRSKLG